MRIPPVERRHDLLAMNPVLVCLRHRIVAGMEARMSLLHRQHAHRRRQQPVDRLPQVKLGNRILQTESSHLRQRMHAGVGAARTSHVHRLAFDSGDDLFECALDCREPGLHLPAVEIGAVIGHRDPDAPVGIGP